MPKRPDRPRPDDSFTLHDLRIEVVATERPMICNHQAGDWFELSGENLRFPPGQTFPLYPLAALLPLLPAKQRPTHPHDWMTTDAEIACPDPHCGGRFRITRIGTSTFSHAAVTAVPLPRPDADAHVRAALGLPTPRAGAEAAGATMPDAKAKDAKAKDAKAKGTKAKGTKAKGTKAKGAKAKGAKAKGAKAVGTRGADDAARPGADDDAPRKPRKPRKHSPRAEMLGRRGKGHKRKG